MTTADFPAKLTAVINAEPDPDEDITLFWSEFTKHYVVLAAALDSTGVVTLCISLDMTRPLAASQASQAGCRLGMRQPFCPTRI